MLFKGRNKEEQTRFDREQAAAYMMLWDMDPVLATDAEVADAIAEYLIASALLFGRKIHLSIHHDMRARSKDGPCPLPYDWRYKNIVGITTDDEARARKWCLDALALGYSVIRNIRRGSGGGGMGTVQSWRRRRIEEIEFKNQRAAS